MGDCEYPLIIECIVDGFAGANIQGAFLCDVQYDPNVERGSYTIHGKLCNKQKLTMHRTTKSE